MAIMSLFQSPEVSPKSACWMLDLRFYMALPGGLRMFPPKPEQTVFMCYKMQVKTRRPYRCQNTLKCVEVWNTFHVSRHLAEQGHIMKLLEPLSAGQLLCFDLAHFSPIVGAPPPAISQSRPFRQRGHTSGGVCWYERISDYCLLNACSVSYHRWSCSPRGHRKSFPAGETGRDRWRVFLTIAWELGQFFKNFCKFSF